VEGHGDLRTEHVCMENGVDIIDCLEFSEALRINDPLDELAFLALECERFGAPGLGDRVLVHFDRVETGEYEARLIKKLGQSAHRILGVIRRSHREIRVEPVDRKSKESLVLAWADGEKVKDGDLVLATVGAQHQRYGPKHGKLVEIVGREDEPRAASLIAIHSHGIPTGFSPEAEAEAEAARSPTLAGREDLRDLPFITIDPADARDHDDAVFAHPDPEAKNVGGWIVWVAIADVAAYVRPGTALDVVARDKSNSVYFPDRVEAMLPEVLSNGLCSLREARTARPWPCGWCSTRTAARSATASCAA